MFVFYDPATYQVQHIINVAPPTYQEFLEQEGITNFILTNETIPINEIEVLPDLTIRQRVPMGLVIPPALTVNVESIIAGVPDGSLISINGVAQGTMDASTTLEFTPQTEGSYRFEIECSGYIKKDFTLEAIIQN
jgi:hypothetical protein